MFNPRVLPYRRCGRAHSPPTWAWYEQLQPEDLESGSDYCSDDDIEDDEHDANYHEDDSCSDNEAHIVVVDGKRLMTQDEADSEEMRSVEIDLNRNREDEESVSKTEVKTLKDSEESDNEQTPRLTSEMKGKQKAVDFPTEEPISAPPKKTKKKKRTIPLSATKPILTIKSSQGFVWNQDLFVPSYIKDRYYMSTSPPNPSHAIPMLASSCDTLNDYELDVVEIRVTGNELNRFRS